MSVEVELPGGVLKRLQAVGDPDKGSIGSGSSPFKRSGKRTEFVSLDRIPSYSQSQQTDMRTRIREIDRLLIKSAENPILWKERAGLSWQLKAPISALVGSLTGAILERNPGSFLDHVFDFCQANQDFSLLDAETVSAIDRGNLLASIRTPKLEAELHYALHLAFATRFQDADIFRQAIDAMRTGYSGEKRPFHDFLDNRALGAAEGGSRGKITLLGLNDLKRIRNYVDKFLQYLGCCRDYGVIALVRRQFNLLLRTHLDEQAANRLVSSAGSPGRSGAMMHERWEDLEHWPDLPNTEHRPESTRRWYDLLTMSKLKDTTLSDFFTGNLYKPVFLYHRQTAGGKGEIERTFWLSQLPADRLPPVSDGRAIARAIYERYIAGHDDWDEYFRNAADGTTGREGLARGQRVLLLLVSEFGPLQDFKAFLPPLRFTVDQESWWDIFTITYYTDLYRLYLAYHQPIDEQRLFNILLQHLPKPPEGANHFRDGAEWVILCLFLSTSPVRRFQLDELFKRTLSWLEFAANEENEELFDGFMTIASFLEIGVLADLVAEDLEMHQFHERRRALWLEHARSLSGSSGFDRWMTQYQSAAGRPK